MKPTKIEVHPDEDGQWRWRLRAPNGAALAVSDRGYATERRALAAADRIATIVVETEHAVVVKAKR